MEFRLDEGALEYIRQGGLERSVSIDIEAAADAIEAVAGLRLLDGQTYSSRTTGSRSTMLKDLDRLCDGTEFIVGHNVTAHDLPEIGKRTPELALLRLPAVDTLVLSPIAFPQRPYHRLVKPYKTPGLERLQVNDPLIDAGTTALLLGDICKTLQVADTTRLAAWHWLLTHEAASDGYERLFARIRGAPKPEEDEGVAATLKAMDGLGCPKSAKGLAESARDAPLLTAWLLAWAGVAETGSVVPAYIWHRDPAIRTMVRTLRATPCGDSACEWCSEHQDPERELKRWFGLDGFRHRPSTAQGGSVQREIVCAHLAGTPLLAVMPTGAGKSLCYQLPAVMRHANTAELTVVISPLVALMVDQVDGMRRRGIDAVVTLNSLLSAPERTQALEQIVSGEAGIALIAPESLRSRPVRKALEQRLIGAWVIDEAHCVSKWGHDFRPDYRYVARFMRKRCAGEAPPTLLALTATAKHEVIDDIRRHFETVLGIELSVIDAGAKRENLDYQILPKSGGTNADAVWSVLNEARSDTPGAAAIVYCITRRETETLAQALCERGLKAGPFHGNLRPERKKTIQDGFMSGELDVVVATKAFGMGVDKADVRMVIHTGVPSSLEDYYQEAGRAGRDQQPAQCVLLYHEDDVERQLRLAATGRVGVRDVQGTLKALRAMRRRRSRHKLNGSGDEVVATVGEILAEDDTGILDDEPGNTDVRMRVVLAQLEEAELVAQEEHSVRVYPSSMKVATVEAANRLIDKAAAGAKIKRAKVNSLKRVVEVLIGTGPGEALTTDDICARCAVEPREFRSIFTTLEHLGIVSNDLSLTVYIHKGGKSSSQNRFAESSETERTLIDVLRETAPDDEALREAPTRLRLRQCAEKIRGIVQRQVLPETVLSLLRSIARDGRGEGTDEGSLSVRKLGMDSVRVRLHRSWDKVARAAELRRTAARLLVEHLVARVPKGKQGADLLVETTYGALEGVVRGDIELRSELRAEPRVVVDRALMWLHEQKVVVLHQGMTVFRRALTLHVENSQQRYRAEDHRGLEIHYGAQTAQVHILDEYARRGLDDIGQAQRLAGDYFELDNESFIGKWMGERRVEMTRQTLPQHYDAIVTSLGNVEQRHIVQDDRTRTNVLVLAGPGSGKTRVLVHRIAYLIRVRRVRPNTIVALAYNRHAAVEIRRRLRGLVDDDARRVQIMTCHSFAMWIVGRTAGEGKERWTDEDFREVLREAARTLKEETEGSMSRDRLMQRYHWILVDEYQDIGEDEYELISALAGLSLADEDARIQLFAVGDDDQNVYGFKGASVEFIRRFEDEYKASRFALLENYRSTWNIIEASEAIIAGGGERMKDGTPLSINRARAKDPPGGPWQQRDPIAQGRVQILEFPGGDERQGAYALGELERLVRLNRDWAWNRVAIVARNWVDIEPIHALCREQGIPVQRADDEPQSFWHARETQRMLDRLAEHGQTHVPVDAVHEEAQRASDDRWGDLLREAMDVWRAEEEPGETIALTDLKGWLREWSRDLRREQRGLLLTSAHRAKGLEFDHVVILDGRWRRQQGGEDDEATRRLYYVAMTRARLTLTLMRGTGPEMTARALQAPLEELESIVSRKPSEPEGLADANRAVIKRYGLRDVNLGYAGLFPEGHRIHRAIVDARTGDPLALVENNGKWDIRDAQGRMLGRMAKRFEPPDGSTLAGATVDGIFRWSTGGQAREGEKWQPKVGTWEVVIPEITWRRT